MTNQIDNRLFISNNRCQKAKEKYLQQTVEKLSLNLGFYTQLNIIQQKEQNKDIFRHAKKISLPSTFIKLTNEGKVY